ncbi:MAG: disulfide bond formation protein DsbC [Methylophaga sp.]|nr:MAG: disulfide bond formation protein DsbC [Methylophaga sp.]
MLKRQCLWLILLAWMGIAQAADNTEMREKLELVMPGVNIESLQPLDNTGLYEVVINGEILYFSEDARYAIQGDVISLETRQNLTEIKRVNMKKKSLASLDEADLIIYEPEKVEHTLTVFTDIDCGYCRKLHKQMAEYNAQGIRIRYMAFPRSGVDSEAFDKAEDVWCAKDRQQAMTDAKNDKHVVSDRCDSPVKAQYEMGQRLGVKGTPSLFLESGEMLPGYVAPKRLKKILDERAAAS